MNKNVVLSVVLMLTTLLLMVVFTTLKTATVTAVSYPTTTATNSPPHASPICSQLVINGNMAEDLAWIMPATPATAAYSTAQAHSGARSIRIGIISGPNREAYSSAYQPITIPANTVTATLRFWLYPIATGTLSGSGTAVDDAQYAMILNENGYLLQTLLWTRQNSQVWQPYSFDLSQYAGQTIRILFGVYNNGIGGTTGMYLDSVSLDACRPLPDMPYKSYLPLSLHNFTPPPEDLLMIDGEVVTRLIGHPDSQTMYGVTAVGLYRSDDAATSWTMITDTLPVTGTILLAPNQPEILYAGDGYPCFKGGPPTPFWRSDDQGASWTQLPAGTNLQPMAVHPDNWQRIYAETCDGPRLSDDGGASWLHQEDDLFLMYNVFHLAAAAADDWQTVYIGAISEGGSSIIIGSQDGGDSWDWLTPLGADIWAISTMALDPISTTHLYFGETLRFWGTLDGGTTWYTSTTGLEDVIYDPEGPGDQTYGLLSLVIRPTNRAQLWLGTAAGLYASEDRGLTWAKVTGTVWEDARIEAVLLQTAVADKLYLTTPDGVFVYQIPLFGNLGD